MYAPSLHHKWHMLDLSATFIEHHQKVAAALLIVMILGALFSLASRLEVLRAFEFSRDSEMSRLVAETAGSLTRLTDPANALESAPRTAYIMASLDSLRKAGQIDRAYVAVYEYAPSRNLIGLESQVFAMFESHSTQIAPQFENFQRISRENWIKTQLETQAMSSLFLETPQSYGIELYNKQGMPIGYLGIERMQGRDFFRNIEYSQLQQTARQIEQALLQPLDTLTHP